MPLGKKQQKDTMVGVCYGQSNQGKEADKYSISSYQTINMAEGGNSTLEKVRQHIILSAITPHTQDKR